MGHQRAIDILDDSKERYLNGLAEKREYNKINQELEKLFDPKNIDQMSNIMNKLICGFFYDLIFWGMSDSDWHLCKKTVEFIVEKLLQNKDAIASDVFIKVLFDFSIFSYNEGIENLAEQILDSGRININDTSHHTNKTIFEFSTDIDMIHSTGGKFITTLIAKGANVNKQSDKNGETALMRAIEKLNIAVIEALLNYEDINTNLVNKNGDTALLKLFSTKNFLSERFIGALKLLLNAKNVDINGKDKDGNTALMKLLSDNHYDFRFYEKKKEILDLLLKHNASVFVLNKSNLSPWQLAEGNQKEILRSAVQIQYKEIKERFKENNIDVLNKNNEQPRLEQLMLSFKSELIDNFNIIKNLLYFGVDIAEDIKELFDFYSENEVKLDNSIFTKIIKLFKFEQETPTTKIFADYFMKMDICVNIFLK